MKQIRRLSALLLALLLALPLAACTGARDEAESAVYDQVMARFTGELEEGAVVKVLENDTAIELGYVHVMK